jgi:quercetin dioxygenase-like cupin family protein
MQRVINILSPHQDGTKELVYNASEVKAVSVRLISGEKSDDCVIDSPVLLFVLDGEGMAVIEGKEYSLKEGDVTVVAAGKKRYLKAGTEGLRLLAVQSHQADRRCGLCSLLESCMSIQD